MLGKCVYDEAAPSVPGKIVKSMT